MEKFLYKLLFNGLIVVPSLIWFGGATLIASLFLALGLTIIAYLIGDQLVLRATNNLVATIADAGLTFAYLWVVKVTALPALSFGKILLISAALGVVEWFYHRYLGIRDTRTRT